MMRVLILGAGGHAQVVADILLQSYQAGANVYPVGFLDDKPTLVGTTIMGLTVLGTVAQLTTTLLLWPSATTAPGLASSNPSEQGARES
jgi:FlaA1/EpsC-like NDP-sugar epimerase